MKKISLAVVSAALAIGMAAPATAAQSDPEVIIYRFPGVRDNGGVSKAGVATVFHCTNFSGVTENIRFVTRGFTGVLLQNDVVFLPHLETRTVATHNVVAFNNLLFLQTGVVDQGTTALAATSTNVICTAVTIDASTVAPVGVALRGIRFNPAPGSQE